MSDHAQNPALEAFLTAGQSAAAEPPPSAPAAPQATEAEPSLDPKQEGSEGSAPPADDDPDDGSGTVPIGALRKSREDWKARNARTEGELAAVKAQLEALQRPQPAPTRPPEMVVRQAPPNPVQDPWGYHSWVQTERVNDKLDWSEAALRDRVGDEEVDATIKDFQSEAAKDPTLWGKLYAQANPYAWAHKQMAQTRVVRDIGTDPNAYREKLRAEVEAEIRAKMAAEQPQGAAAPPVSPAAGLPPSLATVRSSAPRAQVFNGPPSMEDIVGRRSGDNFVRQR